MVKAIVNKAPRNHERVGINILELFQIFPDELSARKWFENTRWKYKRHCGSARTKPIPNVKPMTYNCRDFQVNTIILLKNYSMDFS